MPLIDNHIENQDESDDDNSDNISSTDYVKEDVKTAKELENFIIFIFYRCYMWIFNIVVFSVNVSYFVNKPFDIRISYKSSSFWIAPSG